MLRLKINLCLRGPLRQTSVFAECQSTCTGLAHAMVHRGLLLQSSMGKLHRKRLNSRLSGSMRGAGESLKTLRCQTNSDIRVGTDHGDALLSVNMDIHALASAVLLVFVSHGICPVSGSGFSELAPRHLANGGSATLGWDISGTVFHLNPGESGKLLLFCPPPDRHQAFLDTAVDSQTISSSIGTTGVTFAPLVNMREENCQFRLFVKGTVVPDLARGLWDFSFTKGPNEPTQAHLSMVSVPRFYISPKPKKFLFPVARPTHFSPKSRTFFF